MHKYSIVVTWNEEFKEYIAICPGIPEFQLLTGESKNMMDAVEELNVAIDMALEDLRERNRELPKSNLNDLDKINSVFELFESREILDGCKIGS